jgi:alkylated DNA repair dioxygenase AlkB
MPAVGALTFQGSLFGAGEPAVDASVDFERLQLDPYSWVDIARGWMTGGDELFARLAAMVSWQQHERPMYDRIVAVPRLTAGLSLADEAVPTALTHGARVLGERYTRRFDRLGLNLYRTGADSVAWHGDRVGRHVERPVVAILTLGGARPFALRPRGGGTGRRILPRCGDLLVMGGLVQTRWEHAVPKVRVADPRLSVMFRYGPDGRVPDGARNVTPRASWESPR